MARDLTGQRLASFVPGWLRVRALPHLAVFDLQVLPVLDALALSACTVFQTRRRARSPAPPRRVLQNLSCVYYLCFSAIAGAYCLFERGGGGCWRDSRTWLSCSRRRSRGRYHLAFVSPYLELSGRPKSACGAGRSLTVLADLGRSSRLEYSLLWGDLVRASSEGRGRGISSAAILALAIVGLVANVEGDAAVFALGPSRRWLALGPRFARRRVIGTDRIASLAYLPGFDGVPCPARYLLIVALFLAVWRDSGRPCSDPTDRDRVRRGRGGVLMLVERGGRCRERAARGHRLRLRPASGDGRRHQSSIVGARRSRQVRADRFPFGETLESSRRSTRAAPPPLCQRLFASSRGLPAPRDIFRKIPAISRPRRNPSILGRDTLHRARGRDPGLRATSSPMFALDGAQA